MQIDNTIKKVIAGHLLFVYLLILFFLDYSMAKDSVFTFQTLYLYPIYLLLITSSLFILVRVMETVSNRLYLLVSSISTCFILLFTYLSFPACDSYALSEIPSKILYQRSIYKEIKLNEVFFDKNDDFVKKMVMYKYRLSNKMHKIMITDSAGVFINDYNLIINGKKIYSLNGNISYEVNEGNISITDILPDKTKIIYYIPKQYPEYVFIKDVKGIYNITIRKKVIIFRDFYLLDFVASLSAL